MMSHKYVLYGWKYSLLCNFKQFWKQGKQTVTMVSPLGKTFALYVIENASMQLKSNGEWAGIKLKQVVILFH